MNLIKNILKKQTPGLAIRLKYYKDWFTVRYYKRIHPSQYPNMLKHWYKRKTGMTLNLENPITYGEKIQWLKLYDYTPEKTELSDKYRVRKWVADRIGDEYLIPLLGVWERAEEIDFNVLPNQFVLKTNHGYGTNIIVKDKSNLNFAKTRKQLNQWLKLNFSFISGFELQYDGIKPLILADKYLENMDGSLSDYKFLCFDGEPKYCWLDADRFTNHKRNIYDLNWELQPWNQYKYNYDNSTKPTPKPENFKKMVELARILSKGFIHVRVDFYNVSGKIYFGEMTFTNGSGIEPIYPYEYAKILGDLINTGK